MSFWISSPKDPQDIYNATKEDVNYAISHPFRKHHNPVRLAMRTNPLSPSDEFNLANLKVYDAEQGKKIPWLGGIVILK